MKINICCVNYNSYESLNNYLVSIDTALAFYPKIELYVYICDNSEKKQIIDDSFSFPISIFNSSNIGYFGGISKIIEDNPDVLNCDYFIISNVDLEIDKSFFEILSSIDCPSNVGCLAPNIYSKKDKLNRNPKILYRYTKRKLRILKFMYDFPIVYYVYQVLLYKMRRKSKIIQKNQTFYAPHGSFIILTGNFIKLNNGINYPIFLFGEEIYIGECLLKNHLILENKDNLIVYDNDHISTSKMKSNFYFKCNSEALKYIMETFYE